MINSVVVNTLPGYAGHCSSLSQRNHATNFGILRYLQAVHRISKENFRSPELSEYLEDNLKSSVLQEK